MSESIKEFYIENGKIENKSEWKDDLEGKVIYEVLRVIDGEPLFYEEHYKRMDNSFKISNCDFTFEADTLYKDIISLIKKNECYIGNIKMTYNILSNKFKIYFIKHSYPTTEMYKDGVKTILYFGERDNPNAKVINKSFRDSVNKELKEKDSYEAILVDKNGHITEGSRSNIFMIKENKLYTSKVEAVLPGVTRTEIILMAKENNIQVIEKNILYKDLDKFDALFISGTSPNILPIRRVEDIEFNVNNEFMRKLMDLFKIKIKKCLSR